MSDFLQRIDRVILTRQLLKPGQSLLVAVSGGVDSMVLLSVLHRLSQKNGWRLAVAHLNHQLRGRSSDADERLVKRVAKNLGVRVVCGKCDVKPFAKAKKLSIEMAARKLRHDFLAKTAHRLNLSTIALAHHADDQMELFFLRLLRGSGSEGLAGMKWTSRSPADPKLNLIRPFLDCSKKELVEFAVRNGVSFREDSTNASLDFQRNRIRHELLPQLERNYQPALSRVVERVVAIASEQADFVNLAAEAWLKRSGGQRFDRLHVAVQRRCVQLQLLQLGLNPDFELIEALRVNPERSISCGVGMFICRDPGGRIQFRKQGIAESGVAKEICLKGSDAVDYEHLRIGWRISRVASHKLQSIKPIAGQESFDADKVGDRIVLRHWRRGDRFQPIGMPVEVKLQDLFTNAKIPREERHKLVIATTQSGELFWVEKLRISEGFKLSPSTNRRLLWTWKTI